MRKLISNTENVVLWIYYDTGIQFENQKQKQTMWTEMEFLRNMNVCVEWILIFAREQNVY